MKENKLQPATDAEISQAIEETLNEMEDEFKAIFNAPPTEEELAFEKEFDAATTVKERTAVMKNTKSVLLEKEPRT